MGSYPPPPPFLWESASHISLGFVFLSSNTISGFVFDLSNTISANLNFMGSCPPAPRGAGESQFHMLSKRKGSKKLRWGRFWCQLDCHQYSILNHQSTLSSFIDPLIFSMYETIAITVCKKTWRWIISAGSMGASLLLKRVENIWTNGTETPLNWWVIMMNEKHQHIFCCGEERMKHY